MKAPRTLILLAAARDLRLLRGDGVGKGLEELAHLTWEDLPDVDFEFSDRAPRERGGGLGGSLHTIDPRQTEREKERGRMVGHAIRVLGEEWAKGGYDRIVMSAPDKMLGLLRNALPKELADNMAADMDKDLVKIPLHDLPKHLAAVIKF